MASEMFREGSRTGSRLLSLSRPGWTSAYWCRRQYVVVLVSCRITRARCCGAQLFVDSSPWEKSKCQDTVVYKYGRTDFQFFVPAFALEYPRF